MEITPVPPSCTAIAPVAVASVESSEVNVGSNITEPQTTLPAGQLATADVGSLTTEAGSLTAYERFAAAWSNPSQRDSLTKILSKPEVQPKK